MVDAKDPKLALFELYLATAEKVSERRAQANVWMLSVNSSIVGLYGYLQTDKMVVGASQKAVWLWAIPTAGVIVCMAWAALLMSYRKLNRAKFGVLSRLEKDFPVPAFTLEREIYQADKRRSFSQVESLIPGCFALLYGMMLLATLLNWSRM